MNATPPPTLERGSTPRKSAGTLGRATVTPSRRGAAGNGVGTTTTSGCGTRGAAGVSASGSSVAGADVGPRRGRLSGAGDAPYPLRRSHSADAKERLASESPYRRRTAAVKQAPADLYDVVQPLLQPGSSSERQQTALTAVAQALRSGASPNKWQGPTTPLRNAVQVQHADLTRLLLTARANPNEKDTKGVGVLHIAAFDGQPELCKLLLDSKAEANMVDQHGQSPLFFAPLSGVCEVLCGRKADVNLMNQKGQSALHLAGQAGLDQVLVWLAGRVSKPVLELRDVHGATAAYYARHAGVQPEVLIKSKLVNLEPPQLAGRSALGDQAPPAKRKGSTGSASTTASIEGAESKAEGQSEWVDTGLLGRVNVEKLPSLMEEQEEDVDASGALRQLRRTVSPAVEAHEAEQPTAALSAPSTCSSVAFAEAPEGVQDAAGAAVSTLAEQKGTAAAVDVGDDQSVKTSPVLLSSTSEMLPSDGTAEVSAAEQEPSRLGVGGVDGIPSTADAQGVAATRIQAAYRGSHARSVAAMPGEDPHHEMRPLADFLAEAHELAPEGPLCSPRPSLPSSPQGVAPTGESAHKFDEDANVTGQVAAATSIQAFRRGQLARRALLTDPGACLESPRPVEELWDDEETW